MRVGMKDKMAVVKYIIEQKGDCNGIYRELDGGCTLCPLSRCLTGNDDRLEEARDYVINYGTKNQIFDLFL